MNPYYFPQIRIATVEGLPDTASVSWEMDFIGDHGDPSRLELFEQGHSAVVHISDYVYGTLVLTPTITGADVVVGPITLEFTEIPNAVWVHGGQDQQTAAVTLVPERFLSLGRDDDFTGYHQFTCYDSRRYLDILQASEVNVVINYNYYDDCFVEVLCQEHDAIERIGTDEILIRNPRGPVFFKLISPYSCQGGNVDVFIDVSDAQWAYETEEQPIELGAPIQETLWVASFPEDANVCDYTVIWEVEHYPEQYGTKFIPRMIELNNRTLAFTTELSGCTPLAQPLSPGVVEIFPILIPKFNGLSIVDLEPLYMTLTLGGCSAPYEQSQYRLVFVDISFIDSDITINDVIGTSLEFEYYSCSGSPAYIALQNKTTGEVIMPNDAGVVGFDSSWDEWSSRPPIEFPWPNVGLLAGGVGVWPAWSEECLFDEWIHTLDGTYIMNISAITEQGEISGEDGVRLTVSFVE